MSPRRLPGARAPIGPASRFAIGLLAIGLLAAACGTIASATPRAPGLPSGPGDTEATIGPTTTPTPTPLPTPAYTNPPDPALAALVPTSVGGHAVTVPPPDQFAITPGDVGEAFGTIGLRFRALQVAYVPRPHALSLFAMRVAGDPVSTEELEPYLPSAAQYVGIHALEREPWELETIAGRLAWMRPEDDATAAGTMLYIWAARQYVFLMIGTDDALNRAMFAALPGEAAPTPSPRPSRSPAASRSGAASASPSTSPTPAGASATGSGG